MAAARSFAKIGANHAETPEAEEAAYMLGRCYDEAGNPSAQAALLLEVMAPAPMP